MKYIREYNDIDFNDWDEEEIDYNLIDNQLKTKIINFIKYTHTTHTNISKYSHSGVPNSFFGESLCLYLESYEYSIKFPHLYPHNFNKLLNDIFHTTDPNNTDIYKAYTLLSRKYDTGNIIKRIFDNNNKLMRLRMNYNHTKMYNDIINNRYI